MTSSPDQWAAVDRYFDAALLPEDAVLAAALHESAAAGLPPIHVPPNVGQLLQVLAASSGARRILEVGTLGAYSTIWLARALGADGHLITLEIDPRHAQVARRNLDSAQLAASVQVLVGPALDSLAQLAATAAEPFDFVFIDADKENNTAYFEWALRLTRPGSLIFVDNVVRNGAVIDAASADSRVQGVRHLVERVAAEPRVQATALQLVGSKGYDGWLLMRVLA